MTFGQKHLPVVPWVPINTILSWGSCCKNLAILTPSPLDGSAVSKFAAMIKFLSLSRTTTLCPRCIGDLSIPLTLIDVRPVPFGSSSPSATIATLTNPGNKEAISNITNMLHDGHKCYEPMRCDSYSFLHAYGCYSYLKHIASQHIAWHLIQLVQESFHPRSVVPSMLKTAISLFVGITYCWFWSTFFKSKPIRFNKVWSLFL